MAGSEYVNPLDLDLLTDIQKENLDDLISRFSQLGKQPNTEYLQDKHYVINFLKARNFDVDKAEEMLRNHYRIRKALHLDQATTDYPIDEIMSKYYTRGRYGNDKHGRPVVYFPFGGIDPKGILSSTRFSQSAKAIVYWQEDRRQSLRESSEKFGRLIQQVIYILDLKGLGTAHLYKPGMDALQNMAKIVEQNTPEIIYQMYIINAPALFPTLYALVKPILSERTQSKVRIYGHTGWQSELRQIIDVDQLPVYYGGTASDGDDPKCSKFISYGGAVPKELYFNKEQQKSDILPDNAELKDITIARGQQALHRLTVDKDNSILFWYGEMDSQSDVGFGIYEVPESLSAKPDTELLSLFDEMRMVTVFTRYVMHMVPEWGHLKVNKGLYVVRFDNSYSWLLSKTIHFHAQVYEDKSTEFKSLSLT